MLQNAYLDAKFRFDTDENEPKKEWCVVADPPAADCAPGGNAYWEPASEGVASPSEAVASATEAASECAASASEGV